MKTVKVLMTSTLMFFIICVFGQNRMLFKDTPIVGDVNSFVKELEKEGFIVKEIKENSRLLTGIIEGKTCDLSVFCTHKTKQVWKVKLYFTKETNWSTIKSDYFQLKNLYLSKYGNGKSFEVFLEPHYEGDGIEMQAVKNKKCLYSTFWKLPEGYVILSISEFEKISISFEDAINSNLFTKENDDTNRK